MRNADVYGKDEATRAQAEKREMTRRLALIYGQQHHMEPSAQELLLPDVHTHLEQPMWVIKNWIPIKGPTFVQSLCTKKAKASIQCQVDPRLLWATTSLRHPPGDVWYFTSLSHHPGDFVYIMEFIPVSRTL